MSNFLPIYKKFEFSVDILEFLQKIRNSLPRSIKSSIFSLEFNKYSNLLPKFVQFLNFPQKPLHFWISRWNPLDLSILDIPAKICWIFKFPTKISWIACILAISRWILNLPAKLYRIFKFSAIFSPKTVESLFFPSKFVEYPNFPPILWKNLSKFESPNRKSVIFHY